MSAIAILALPYIAPMLASAGLGVIVPFLNPTTIKMASTALKVISSAKLPPLTKQEKAYIRNYRANRSASDTAHGW